MWIIALAVYVAVCAIATIAEAHQRRVNVRRYRRPF